MNKESRNKHSKRKNLNKTLNNSLSIQLKRMSLKECMMIKLWIKIKRKRSKSPKRKLNKVNKTIKTRKTKMIQALPQIKNKAKKSKRKREN